MILKNGNSLHGGGFTKAFLLKKRVGQIIANSKRYFSPAVALFLKELLPQSSALFRFYNHKQYD